MLVTLSVCSFRAEFSKQGEWLEKFNVFSHTFSFERLSKEAVASLRLLALGIQKQSEKDKAFTIPLPSVQI